MTTKSQLNQFLILLAESLDISDTHYKDAETRYKAVGSWLSKEGSPLSLYNPDVYPQGSFRLGTVIRPLNDEDEYDIDLVCELNFTRGEISQKDLKHRVGDRLKANKIYEQMLDEEEGRRCWTLNYADGANFHMDILPAIPESDSFKAILATKGVPSQVANLAISITDKKFPSYDRIDNDWPRSNPRGYAEWFKNRMIVRFDALRKSMAESMRAGVEEVPEYSVKTPLQQAVQILKRHRDLMFQNDADDKPISIIITTLAAHAYNNEANLLDALTNIVNRMSQYIQTMNGISWVANPVNPLENFADKWQEHPQREIKFRAWIQQVGQDLIQALQNGDIRLLDASLSPKFGGRAVRAALSKIEQVVVSALPAANIQVPRVEIASPNKPWRCHE
jgi:hypothetical protein